MWRWTSNVVPNKALWNNLICLLTVDSLRMTDNLNTSASMLRYLRLQLKTWTCPKHLKMSLKFCSVKAWNVAFSIMHVKLFVSIKLAVKWQKGQGWKLERWGFDWLCFLSWDNANSKTIVRKANVSWASVHHFFSFYLEPGTNEINKILLLLLGCAVQVSLNNSVCLYGIVCVNVFLSYYFNTWGCMKL